MAGEPFQALSTHAQRYERLLAMFRKWHEVVKGLPSFGNGNPPLLASMTIGAVGADGLEPNTFAMTLAGTTVYIRLDYLPGGEYGTEGILQAYVREPFTKLPFLLTPIPFKGNGHTKLTTEIGIEVMLGEQVGAFFVAGQLMKAALERTEPVKSEVTTR